MESMETPLECIRCRGAMDDGYIVDRGDSARREQLWVSGPFEWSLWGRLKITDRPTFVVQTYRCQRCGYLESYATEPGRT